MNGWLRWRSGLDRVIAFAVGVPASVFVAVIAAIVRRETPGPGLIRLDRVGVDGRLFGMVKVRSMHQAAGERRAAGLPLTAVGDRRVTRVGRTLRRWHLDELPQLLNIVRGEMALIGPRPETPECVDLGDARWRRVLGARPGIAGPTQLVVGDWEAQVIAERGIDGYARDVVPIKLAIDEWYVEHASPVLDALVVWSLVQRFVGRRQRTAVHSRVERDVVLDESLREALALAP